MFCGKCGANIPDGNEFCTKCGTKIDVSQVDSNEAAVVEGKAEKKAIKTNIIVSGLVGIIIIMLAVLVFSLKDSNEKRGYFANIPWGTDFETVQKKVNKEFNCESSIAKENEVLFLAKENYDDMQGVRADLIFYCEEKATLSRVEVMIVVEDGSEYTGDEIADKLINKYNKLYGEAENDGHTYEWITKNSTIDLKMATENHILLYYNK